jgi:hypothetical protein
MGQWLRTGDDKCEALNAQINRAAARRVPWARGVRSRVAVPKRGQPRNWFDLQRTATK